MKRGRWRLAYVGLCVVWTACGSPERGQPDPAAGGAAAGGAAYVPGEGDDWARIDPAEAGFDPDALAAAVDSALAHETSMPLDPGEYLRDRFEGQRWQEIVGPTRPRGGVNGILLKDGYIVAEWGDTRRPDMTFSVTKSYLSTVVGLAWDDRLIPDLDAPVAKLIDDGGFESPHNARITWRHHLRQLSEWEGTLFGKPDQADRRRGVDRELREPGTFWEYNDVRVNRLALSALRLFGEPLPEVLDRRIMDPIGASDTWEWHGYETSWVDVDGERMQSVSGGGHWGGGMFISSRDHARFGLLMLRRGLWGERRLLSEAWVDEALTPSIQPDYGFMWWLNTGRERFPNALESSFFALGAASTSTIWVDPENDLVLVSRWIDGPEVNELIGRIVAALQTDDAASAPPARGGLRVGVAPSFQKVFFEEPTAFDGHFGPRIEIEMVRNEVEGAQLVLFPEEDVAGAIVDVGPLTGSAGAAIAAADVEVRAVGYVNLPAPRIEGSRVGWHPDPLLPNRPVDLEAGTPQPFLISVRTRPDTAPGDYTGRVVIAAGPDTVSRELAVRVRDVTLPSRPRFKAAGFADWTLPDRMWPPELGYEEPDDETRLALMLSLADLGFAYRLPPTVALANGLRSWNADGRGATRPGFPTHDRGDDAAPVFNRERTDRLIDYMLDRGANHFFVAVTSNVWRPEADADARAEALAAYLRDYRDHLAERELLDLAIVYNIDEPWRRTVADSKRTYTLVREAVGADLRVMQNTNQNNPDIIPSLLGFFDILDVNLGFHDGMRVADYRARHGQALSEVWWNINRWPDSRPNLFLEYPLVDARIIGPMSYAFDIDGFEYWAFLWTPGIGNYHPVAEDELRVRWDVESTSLDGTLVYPGADRSIHPSLRLASLRDGFEDLELLYMLADADPDHELLAVPIVGGLDRYETDPDVILDFRRRVIVALLESGGQGEDGE